jgi:hypothetical protein
MMMMMMMVMIWILAPIRLAGRCQDGETLAPADDITRPQNPNVHNQSEANYTTKDFFFRAYNLFPFSLATL